MLTQLKSVMIICGMHLPLRKNHIHCTSFMGPTTKTATQITQSTNNSVLPLRSCQINTKLIPLLKSIHLPRPTHILDHHQGKMARLTTHTRRLLPLPALLALLLLLLLGGTAAAKGKPCVCNSYRNVEPAGPATYNNVAQQLARLAWTYLHDVAYKEHHLALMATAMFDALVFWHGQGRVSTVVLPNAVRKMKVEVVVAYAGFATLHDALRPDAAKTRGLAADMRALGYGDVGMRERIGAPFARAMAAKFPLGDRESFRAPNAASDTRDAACSRMKMTGGWQPLCVADTPGAKCTVQILDETRYFNASIMARNGRPFGKLPERRSLNFSFALADLHSAKNSSRDSRDHFAVTWQTKLLDDERKAAIELFSGDAMLSALHLLLDEFAVRSTRLRNSIKWLWMVSGAMRDAAVISRTHQMRVPKVRPLSVIQCGLRGRHVTSWRGPYQGVGGFRVSDSTPWRPYLRTSAEPGAESRRAAIAYAAMIILRKEITSMRGANCMRQASGTSRIEPRITRGNAGYVRGVTDVPNAGLSTRGYSPARDVTVCWKTFLGFEKQQERAEVHAGLFISRAAAFGGLAGRWAGLDMFYYVRNLRCDDECRKRL